MDQGAVRRGRVECWNAGPAGSDSLGKSSLVREKQQHISTD